MKRFIAGILALVLACGAGFAAFVYSAGRGWLGAPESPGEIAGARLPDSVLERHRRDMNTARAGIGASADKSILFGDLHVHTTFSVDAFFMSLPAMQGEGAHPVADACDFARYCSGLDFWSINDHAESLTPTRWQQTVEAIRRCNQISGDARDPDVVAFLGWEWTQVGTTPADHYGHKNVILADTDDGRIPTRPIFAHGMATRAMAAPPVWGLGMIAVLGGGGRLYDLARHLRARSEYEECPADVSARALPADCLEGTATPAELFRKLNEWGHRAIVIPHGTTWGFYTPPGSTWDKQLTGNNHDPNRQVLLEVYSGHGNSEEYRDWRAVDLNGDSSSCPPPAENYLPTCWRAGEIIGERCRAADLGDGECDKRETEARQIAADHGGMAHLTVPAVAATDWLDAGQCTDCFQPAFNYRPGGSAQYITALTNFDDPASPRRFRFGFMASSDVHTARPGTGYKEYNRREMTEAAGPGNERTRDFLARKPEEAAPRARPFDIQSFTGVAFALLEAERQASFFLTGGLVAAHAESRDRESIWRAFERREVYGTSGPRILLWFDLLDGTAPTVPMGSAVRRADTPTFRVRAVGSLEQKPGCPDHSLQALSAERLEHLCRGECYNPSDSRRRITRIEVIRIRPQARPGEPIAPLVEDTWKTLPCPADPSGCEVTFDDPEFASTGRDTVYYVRAIEEPSLAINAANLRCERDDEGRCVSVNPCYGDFRTDYADDCLAQTEQRAWSSPIFVDFSPAPQI